MNRSSGPAGLCQRPFFVMLSGAKHLKMSGKKAIFLRCPISFYATKKVILTTLTGPYLGRARQGSGVLTLEVIHVAQDDNTYEDLTHKEASLLQDPGR